MLIAHTLVTSTSPLAIVFSVTEITQPGLVGHVDEVPVIFLAER
jgi:hypothetical protein